MSARAGHSKAAFEAAFSVAMQVTLNYSMADWQRWCRVVDRTTVLMRHRAPIPGAFAAEAAARAPRFAAEPGPSGSGSGLGGTPMAGPSGSASAPAGSAQGAEDGAAPGPSGLGRTGNGLPAGEGAKRRRAQVLEAEEEDKEEEEEEDVDVVEIDDEASAAAEAAAARKGKRRCLS